MLILKAVVILGFVSVMEDVSCSCALCSQVNSIHHVGLTLKPVKIKMPFGEYLYNATVSLQSITSIVTERRNQVTSPTTPNGQCLCIIYLSVMLGVISFEKESCDSTKFDSKIGTVCQKFCA